jgi:hypothetical protein
MGRGDASSTARAHEAPSTKAATNFFKMMPLKKWMNGMGVRPPNGGGTDDDRLVAAQAESTFRSVEKANDSASLRDTTKPLYSRADFLNCDPA